MTPREFTLIKSEVSSSICIAIAESKKSGNNGYLGMDALNNLANCTVDNIRLILEHEEPPVTVDAVIDCHFICPGCQELPLVREHLLAKGVCGNRTETCTHPGCKYHGTVFNVVSEPTSKLEVIR